jgi:hypothetical protein
VEAVLTPNEANQEWVAAMGEPLGVLYSALWQEVAWVHRRWLEYVVLFGTKPSRVELLNKAAPSFFSLAQAAIWEQILLHLCRLTDPSKSNGRSNLTIRRIPPLVDPSLTERAQALVDDAIAATAFSRDWRNRRLAHSDFELVLDAEAEPLSAARLSDVRQALGSIASVLNVVSSYYDNSTSLFDLDGPGPPGGAQRLLRVLDDGLKMDAQRWERRRKGEFLPEDARGPGSLS